MPECIVYGCKKAKGYANGLCPMHYQRMKRSGTTECHERPRGPLEDRFWAKVDRRAKDECWLWAGNRRPNGYGSIQSGGRGSPTLAAHRLSYEMHKGPIPAGMVVMHSCDRPSCVNPDHLSVGAPRDNTRDMVAKNRHKRRAPIGEASGVAVLNSEKVRFIRANPDKTHAALARELGVGTTTIRGVRSGRCWSHVV